MSPTPTRSGPAPDRPAFTRTRARQAHLETRFAWQIMPHALADAFLAEPLFQRGHAQGFGTLFTTEYDPVAGALTLLWPDDRWRQTLDNFKPGRRVVRYNGQSTEPANLTAALALVGPFLPSASQARLDTWLASNTDGTPEW